MTEKPQHPTTVDLSAPRLFVVGVGGAGGNAVGNMIQSNLEGVEFLVANTDAQALGQSPCQRRIQMGRNLTQGLGAGSRPDIGRAAAQETIGEIVQALENANMVFITAGMGGGTGTGAAPVIARAAREAGILTVGVVTKPFQFEGGRRMRLAEVGITELRPHVDTLIVIPNQNLFRVANEKTTFADAFKMADDVLHAGVRGVTDLMVMPGLVNLDFADIRAVMAEMGTALMGTGEAEGENRATAAAEAAISNPLLDEVSMKGARGVLINITGGLDLTLFEVDQAANRIRGEVDPEANIIFGSTFDQRLEGRMRVSVVATGLDGGTRTEADSTANRLIVSLYSDGLGGIGRPERPAAEAARAAADDTLGAVAEGEAGDEGGSAPAEPDPGQGEDDTGDSESEPPSARGPASVFPFRARARDKTGQPGLGTRDQGPQGHPVAVPSSRLHPITARSVPTEEPETIEPPNPPAGSSEDAPELEAALSATGAEESAETDTPEAELVLQAETSPAAGPDGEPDEAEPDMAAQGAPQDEADEPAEPRRKKSNAFFSWIAGGGAGNAVEVFRKGERYYYGQGVRKNLMLAFRSYMRAAELGHAAAQNRIGWMYEKGEGVEPDHGEAAKWYRRAAEQGNVNAMNDLGYMYRQGWGVPQSHREALNWFGKAAEKYDSYAEYNMGQMYENGWGVDKDLDEAIRWFRRSAARGHEWAAKRLEELGVKT